MKLDNLTLYHSPRISAIKSDKSVLLNHSFNENYRKIFLQKVKKIKIHSTRRMHRVRPSRRPDLDICFQLMTHLLK